MKRLTTEFSVNWLAFHTGNLEDSIHLEDWGDHILIQPCYNRPWRTFIESLLKYFTVLNCANQHIIICIFHQVFGKNKLMAMKGLAIQSPWASLVPMWAWEREIVLRRWFRQCDSQCCLYNFCLGQKEVNQCLSILSHSGGKKSPDLLDIALNILWKCHKENINSSCPSSTAFHPR